MIEPIDFSDKDNEFLSSDLKQQVLAFSILWAVFGFALSAWIFLGKKVGPASLILDRRQAEGRVIDSSSQGSSTVAGSGGFSSQAPKVRPYVPAIKPEALDEWSHLVRLDQAETLPRKRVDQKPAPAEIVKVEVEANIEENPTVGSPTAGNHRPTAPKRPEQVAQENPDRLLYPVVSQRPEPTSLTNVARNLERSMFRMVNLQGEYHVGLILDSSGKAIVSDSFLQDGSVQRVALDGNMVRGEVLHRDSEYGIALIQLPPGNYATIPLSPVPPHRGEELLAFGPTSSRCVATTVRAGVGFSQAGYLLEGNLGSATWGTPLLNDRGELAGINFSSLPHFPGSGVHLSADSAAIYRLLRGYSNPDPSRYDGTLQEAYARLTSLAGETRDEDGTKKGRILAKVGVSQFFIGMSTQEARRWVTTPNISHGAPGVENWRNQAPPMELVFVNDRLVAVATDFTGFSTVTGLSMGAPVDSRTLSRSFDRFLLVDGLALTPGLDILLDREGKARQFVVRPEL